MKDYLKMADEFDLPVLAEIQRSDFSVISSPHSEVIGGFGVASHSTAAAHAINSHDELVEMNNELIAALKTIGVHTITDEDGDEVEVLFGNMRKIKEAIEKFNGGAA